jgi:hypothetical protein
VPFSVTVDVGFVALLAIEIVPVAAPAAFGANVACSAIDWPADIVTGAATPLTLNAPPVTPVCVICKSLLPEFVSVTAWVTFPFTSTFPKLSAVVLNESCDAADDADPPLSFMCEEFPCEVIAVNVPVADPDVELWNTT